jgi:hypothetical protein
MNLTESDYYTAACLDTAYEGLSVEAVAAAYDVACNGESFFYAVQAAVRLKEICDANWR